MTEADDRERSRLEQVARNMLDAAPVVRALQEAGFPVDGVADLFNKRYDYRRAIPVLMEWLPRIDNPYVKEDVVRALSVKWAMSAAPLLVAELERARSVPDGSSLRWAIGNALEALASDDIADELLRIAADVSLGESRQMVVLGLAKITAPSANRVLIKLLSDDDVVSHAVIALGKRRASEARPYIESLLGHPRSFVRSEAKKALGRIDKASR